jgi:hypothetical protein
MDGMADFNAPAPPMGSEPPMGDPMMDDDPNMGGEMEDQGMEMGGNQEDDELMGIINNLSVEDKAAVLKYAKSMSDDNEGGEGAEMPMGADMGGDPGMAAPGQNQMPESRGLFGKIIDETINSIKGKKDTGMKRPEKGLSKKYRDKKDNPFVSPY